MIECDKYEVQRELERESQSLGVVRYEKLREKRDESEMAPGRALVLRTVDTVAEQIGKFMADADTGKPGRRHAAVKWFREMDHHALAYLTATCVVAGLTVSKTRTATMALNIGQAVNNEINFSKLREDAPGLHRVIQQQLKKSTSATHATAVMNRACRTADGDVDYYLMGEREKALVGFALLDAFITATDLIEIVVVTQNKSRTSYLSGTEETMEWLEKAHESAALFHPVLLPMVVPPAPWTSPSSGGYLGLPGPSRRLVRSRNREYQKELELADMPNVYRAINALQSTPWKINEPVMEVMQQAWDMGGGIGKMPSRELEPLPERPAMLDTNPDYYKEHHAAEFRDWKRERAITYEENARGMSKRVATGAILSIAKRFADEEAIYFPHSLDFRGRAYPLPPMLTPQGDDRAKSLLTFSRGVTLGDDGAYWLAVHLANTFGVDKVSFEDRVAWVYEHEDQILDSAMSPLDGQRFWTDADAPWCALAACIEWLGYKFNGKDHVSHLPIALDGSCNGLQNFSAMLRDPVGGAATNLMPVGVPADIYTEVMDVAQAKIEVLAKGGDEFAIRLDNMLNRDIVKQPVMTLPYGVSLTGMRAQLLGKLTEYEIGSDWDIAMFLAKVLWESIGEVVVAAREAMDWLRDSARIAAKADHPILWTTPAGFPVLQDYRTERGVRVRPHVGGKELNITVNITGETLDRRRQALGISPNFVHSCDASHMMLTVVLGLDNGLEDFAMIHDSFGTHAGNTGVLAAALRQAFVDQYSGDVLGNFRDDLVSQLPPEIAEEIPPLPPMGNLDLQQVLDAPYFFA